MVSLKSRLSGHGGKLVLSLLANVLAKAPGLIATLVLLPIIHRALGVGPYSAFLAALALAGLFSIPFNGLGVIGRRAMGEAQAERAPDKEANAAVSQFLLALIIAVPIMTGAIVVWLTGYAGMSSAVIVVIGLTAILFNTFDNIRGSYNEHYVTATLQFVAQVCIYTAALFAVPMLAFPVIAAMTLQGPMIVASLCTGVALILQRPYLLHGRPVLLRHIGSRAIVVAIADGALMGALNFSVVWMAAVSDPAASAWYGTVCRLFQAFLAPVLLLLFPLGNYLIVSWPGFSNEKRRMISRLLTGFAILYGLGVGVAMVLVGYVYLPRVMNLAPPTSILITLPIFIFLAAIIAQKAYASVAYLVLDGDRLSAVSAIIVVLGVLIAVASGLIFSPIVTLGVLSLVIGLPLFVSIAVNSVRYEKQRLK